MSHESVGGQRNTSVDYTTYERETKAGEIWTSKIFMAFLLVNTWASTLRMEYFVSSYMMALLSGCSLLLCLEAIEWIRDKSRSTSGSFFKSVREASASGERSPNSSDTASRRALMCLSQTSMTIRAQDTVNERVIRSHSAKA